VKQESRLLDRRLEALLGRPGALASTPTGDPLPEGAQPYVSAAKELLGRYAIDIRVKQRVFHVKQESRPLDRWLEALLGRHGRLATTATGDPLAEGAHSYVSAAKELLRPIRDRHPAHVKQRVFHVKQESRLLGRGLEALLGRPGALAPTPTGDPLHEGAHSYVSAAGELLGRYAVNVPPTSNSECFT
jgi:hypothetical protein